MKTAVSSWNLPISVLIKAKSMYSHDPLLIVQRETLGTKSFLLGSTSKRCETNTTQVKKMSSYNQQALFSFTTPCIVTMIMSYSFIK